MANSFLSDGGDNFATFKQGTNRLIGGLDIDSLRLYLQAQRPLHRHADATGSARQRVTPHQPLNTHN